MPRCFTTSECGLIASSYIRNNHSSWSSFPAAIISLMSSFFNLWRHFRLTEDTLQEVRQVSYDEILSIRFTTVTIEDISFQLLLTLSHEPETVEDSDVELTDSDMEFADFDMQFAFAVLCPDHVQWIGGYFENFVPNSESTYVSYRRSLPPTDDGSTFLGEFDRMPLSKCKSLTELQLSIYFDVQQIKYTESAHLPHMDNLSPLKGSGRYQWIIEDEQLSELQQTWCIEKDLDGIPDISGDWNMALTRETDDKEIFLNPIYPFIPLPVCELDLYVEGSYVIKYKINPKEEREIEFSFEDTQTYDGHEVIQFETGITRNDLADVVSITFDVEWKIVKILPEREEQESDSNYEWVRPLKTRDIDPNKFGISM